MRHEGAYRRETYRKVYALFNRRRSWLAAVCLAVIRNILQLWMNFSKFLDAVGFGTNNRQSIRF